MNDHVDDAMIVDAIARHDDPDHPDATTVAEVRDLLAHLQHAVEQGWGEYMDGIEAGYSEVVAETDDLLVLSTGERAVWAEELERTYEGDIDDVTRDVLNAVIHAVADEHSDYNWGTTYPLVVRKPDGVEGGQRYVEAIINGLLRRGLSPGQAWAYYGVEIRGESRNAWSKRCGYSDHSAVSEPLRKAQEKLPANP